MNQIESYYQLGIKSNQKASLVFVGREDKGFDPYRFYSGEIIDDWPPDITFRFSRLKDGREEDVLDGGLHWVLVSDKFRLTCNENFIGGVQFLPVTLVDTTSGVGFAQYWALNVIQDRDALDYENTIWIRKQTMEKDKYPLLNILNPVFRKKMLVGIDIFRLRIDTEIGTTVYVSNKLKNLLENNRSTRGVWFGKIRVL